MFMDFRDQPPPPPWVPRRPPPVPKLTRRQERVLSWIVLVYALLLLLAPICGSSLVDAVAAAFGRR